MARKLIRKAINGIAGDLKMIWVRPESEKVDISEWERGMELIDDSVPVSRSLNYHLKFNIPIGEQIFRYGSDKYFDLLSEVKGLSKDGKIRLNPNDSVLIDDYSGERELVNGKPVVLNHIYENTDEEINKAEYQGKEVELDKPKRGGSKKFYVYTKNPETGKVIKVSFGAKDGGANLSVKINDPEARKRFADRHNCEQKTDKTTPGYWSCRLPRYSKLLGLKGSGVWW